MDERRGARLMRPLAYTSAALILALGLLALAYPAGFAALVAAMQPRPMLYLPAALRVIIGISFLMSARGSRAMFALFFLGLVMIAGGLVMPFIGQGLARPILDAWTSGSSGIVRGWGVAAIALGGFALWGLVPRSPLKTEDQLDDTA